MKTKTWIILLSAVLALCLGLSLWLLLPGEDAVRAEVWSDGDRLYVLDLFVDQSFEIVSGYGANTVTVRDGAIAVTQADCPDHYCMDRGFCSGGSDIICLPNRLVIRFVGQQEIDGVAG